ncbi:sensor histidine kinase [Clostridium algidicarnis]|uniref:sensor histidine kinase n=1 Tax=Clostridium algidicarnis TaxID=37659 RepID=UPI001C0E34DF|nr:HAMP domain-containing sensor histidine kinase [Clostridium algidicarnis]MBU3203941.1 HAMP domain-containing histidine kinase [Clostridium algidicarnis]MBU3212095.1 HAMP domain-containing histidine kinase [Clostridium algidicarnis]MBU3221400.1 HAMP domain-containing histidine kinase [Clostridium algidicarnis]
MKSISKILIRFVATSTVIALLLLFVNISVLTFWAYKNQDDSVHYEDYISSISDNLKVNDNKYILSEGGKTILEEKFKWAMLLDEEGSVVWSEDLPDDIPTSYSMQDIASFSRWYLNDYPVTVWKHEHGLLVLGKNKNSNLKVQITVADNTIESLPLWIIIGILINVIFALGLSLFLGYLLIGSLRPIARGIKFLEYNKDVKLSTKGVLGDLAVGINHASQELQKKEVARANWISGISHDIRTPLSMILGYANHLKNNKELSKKSRDEATIIERQSLRIKDLVNDLNLASKLEYNMQPLEIKEMYISKIIREEVVDIINHDLEEKYSLIVTANDNMNGSKINGDEKLIRRGLHNLIQNSIKHNKDGCEIHIKLTKAEDSIFITVSDNGVGVSKEELEKLKNKSHYILSNNGNLEERHGLGLLIVSQIVEAHGGTVDIESNEGQGFVVTMKFLHF